MLKIHTGKKASPERGLRRKRILTGKTGPQWQMIGGVWKRERQDCPAVGTNGLKVAFSKKYMWSFGIVNRYVRKFLRS